MNRTPFITAVVALLVLAPGAYASDSAGSVSQTSSSPTTSSTTSSDTTSSATTSSTSSPSTSSSSSATTTPTVTTPTTPTTTTTTTTPTATTTTCVVNCGGGVAPTVDPTPPVVQGEGTPPDVTPTPVVAAGGALPFTGIEDVLLPLMLGFVALMGGALAYRYASVRDLLSAPVRIVGRRRRRSGYGRALAHLYAFDRDTSFPNQARYA